MIYMLRECKFTTLELYDLLVDLDEDKVSLVPPRFPKDSEVYIYHPKGVSNPREWRDWTCDGYRWKGDGQHTMTSKDVSVEFVAVNYIVMGKDRQFCRLFTRTAYFGMGCIVVIYLGDDSLAGLLPHGNARTVDHPVHQRTLPSVLDSFKKQAWKKPQDVYKDSIVQPVDGQVQGVANARNPKQVENAVHRARRVGPSTMKKYPRKTPVAQNTSRLDPEASYAVKDNRITLIQKKGVFMVEGDKNALRMNAVTLFPEQSCSCGLRGGDCWHIVACKMAIGLEVVPGKHCSQAWPTLQARRGGAKKKQISPASLSPTKRQQENENSSEAIPTKSQRQLIERSGSDDLPSSNSGGAYA